MTDLIDDATSAMRAYGEAPQGSYMETTLANAICRDIVPALLYRLQNPAKPMGFSNEIVLELENDTEIPDKDPVGGTREVD